jgi:RNA-binding protein
MRLTTRQRQYLKALAHHRRPVVSIGTAGLTEAVIAEIAHALGRHELLKVRLPAVARPERAALYEHLCAATGAAPVLAIGRVAVIYRRAEKPRLVLPE